nr:MAG TPA: hypothetical protein [Bacteriophage sp.]
MFLFFYYSSLQKTPFQKVNPVHNLLPYQLIL